MKKQRKLTQEDIVVIKNELYEASRLCAKMEKLLQIYEEKCDSELFGGLRIVTSEEAAYSSLAMQADNLRDHLINIVQRFIDVGIL